MCWRDILKVEYPRLSGQGSKTERSTQDSTQVSSLSKNSVDGNTIHELDPRVELDGEKIINSALEMASLKILEKKNSLGEISSGQLELNGKF